MGKLIIGFMLLFASILNEGIAQDQCSQILRYGIFDRTNSLDIQSKFEMAKTLACGNTGGKVEIGPLSFGGGTDYCNSDFGSAIQSSTTITQIEKASRTIASAWVQCIEANIGGVSHFITPSSDPAKFAYSIRYIPTGQASSEIIDWNIAGAECSPSLPRGNSIQPSWTQLSCNRNPTDTVLITISVTEGGRNARPIELPAHRPMQILQFTTTSEIPLKKSGDNFISAIIPAQAKVVLIQAQMREPNGEFRQCNLVPDGQRGPNCPQGWAWARQRDTVVRGDEKKIQIRFTNEQNPARVGRLNVHYQLKL